MRNIETNLSLKILERNDLFGREKIEISLSEKDLTAENIKLVLPDVLEAHKKNVSQITFLRDKVRGKQAVLGKVKTVRDNINNKVVENHLSHVISFNKGYVFGDPVQYVQVTDETGSAEDNKLDKSIVRDLNRLNTFMRNNNKASKDLDLVDDILVTGVCPRMIMVGDDKEVTPFEFYNLKPEQAFVVYSNGIKGTPLFSVYTVVKKNYQTGKQMLQLDVRTRTNKYLYTMPYDNFTEGRFDRLPSYMQFKDEDTRLQNETNLLGEIPIVEYEFNKYRISLVEYILSAQDALNKITSADIDDIEQFVQAFMVLINAEIDSETLAAVKEQGAMSVKSTQDLDADVKMLTAKMSHSETKILYDRIYNTMLVNAGVPLINTSSGGGDTGLARLADNGWLMADTKAREKELAFIESERPFIKMALKILERGNAVDKLEYSNIETKFTRNKSDNILTKVQALQSMQDVVHPEIAFAVSGLFNDAGEAYARSSKFYGKDFFKPASVQQEVTEQDTKEVQPNQPKFDNKDTKVDKELKPNNKKK